MGVENEFFWSGLGSEFGEPGGTAQPRIPRSTPRENESHFFLCGFKNIRTDSRGRRLNLFHENSPCCHFFLHL